LTVIDDGVLGQLLLAYCRDTSSARALTRLLSFVPAPQVAEAVTDLVEPGEPAATSYWRDVPALLRRLEQVPGSVDGVPHLLAFVSRLAEAVGGTRAEELYDWIDTVAGGLGVDRPALRRLRRARRHDGGRAAEPQPPRTVVAEPAAPPEGLRQIWGGVPICNPDFTGRTGLLHDMSTALRTSPKASVLPQTVHGLGGVGKTQLVVEYVYRHVDAYDLVWWIPAAHRGADRRGAGVAVDALDRYRGNFGVRHPLTLVAAANVAIILRASGMTAQARALNEHTLDAMTDVLGPEHPYTLCVQSNLANDLAALGDAAAARSLAERTLAASRRVRGDAHPYTLACAVNAAIDRQASGDAEGGRRLLDEALVPLGEALGAEHPEVLDAQRYLRMASDIEPPPT